MTNYLAAFEEIHPRHSGLIFEQLNQASMAATFFMRAMGLTLPDKATVPTQAEVYEHLCDLVNQAFDGYYHAQKQATVGLKPNELFGYAEDGLFSLELTGLSEKEGDGYTANIDFNLLYR